MDREIIPAVLEAADRKIVGRIRVQKIFYLLEKLGLNSGLRFSYHHYGPYSDSLARSMDLAELVDETIIETVEPGNAGSYSVYTSNPKRVAKATFVGALQFQDARNYISKMKSKTSVVIELAATIYWLSTEEKVDDWRKEIKIRKQSKATDQNIREALQLLNEIGLTV